MLTQCRETTCNIHTTYIQQYNIIFTTSLCLKVVNMIYQCYIIYIFIYVLFKGGAGVGAEQSGVGAGKSRVILVVPVVGAPFSGVGAGKSRVDEGGPSFGTGVSGVGVAVSGVCSENSRVDAGVSCVGAGGSRVGADGPRFGTGVSGVGPVRLDVRGSGVST